MISEVAPDGLVADHRRHALGERPALDQHRALLAGAAQHLLLELGLLHQPVREPAQQLELRAAALEAAAPEPGLVRAEHRDPALALAGEHQERPPVRALHHRLAAVGASTSTMRNQRPQPGVPSAAGGRGACSSRPAVTGWRWPTSEIGGVKPSSITSPVGSTGRISRERRAVEALGPGEVLAGGDQQRPAVAHVAGDVLEIGVRQDAAALVAVEDDQVELVDLLHEQLLGREGDQRELEDRHEVLLLRRAQDGEMHQVDRAVGLQQVPPGALAGIGLAGDEQHPQPVAHAVDRDDRLVVARR